MRLLSQSSLKVQLFIEINRFLKKLIRQDEERLEKKRRGELLEGEEEAVITALDMEDAWKKEVGLLLQLVSCRDIQRLPTTPYSVVLQL